MIDREFDWDQHVIDVERMSLGHPRGSVSARASKYSRLDGGGDFSSGLQHGEHRCGTAKEVEPAAVGGDVLIDLGCVKTRDPVTEDVDRIAPRRRPGMSG
jgi:hypothetical protein